MSFSFDKLASSSKYTFQNIFKLFLYLVYISAKDSFEMC